MRNNYSLSDLHHSVLKSDEFQKIRKKGIKCLSLDLYYDVIGFVHGPRLQFATHIVRYTDQSKVEIVDYVKNTFQDDLPVFVPLNNYFIKVSRSYFIHFDVTFIDF